MLRLQTGLRVLTPAAEAEEEAVAAVSLKGLLARERECWRPWWWRWGVFECAGGRQGPTVAAMLKLCTGAGCPRGVGPHAAMLGDRRATG